jgi:uncharacterized protein (TIGR03437 family)
MFNSKLARTGAFALLLVSGSLFGQQPVTVTYTYSGLPAAIYPDNANVITVAGIFVPQAIKMTKVTVQLQISYPNTGDLQVFLYSPEGSRSILLQHDCSIQNVNTTFDDSASSYWRDFCPVEAGRGPFKSDQPLSNSYGDNSSFGTWRLAVENDSSDSRSGWITGFSITITGTTLAGPTTAGEAIVNAGSQTSSATVAPGEMLSIYGLAIGPTTPVTAPAGALPSTLSGSSVTINGIAAPIAYASAFRLDVQAPFGLTPGATVPVLVTYNGQTAAPASVSVATAVPGIAGPASPVAPGTRSFSASTTPAKAYNNGGLNSKSNPAVRGTVLSIYASGLGVVTPALTEGAVPPATPLSKVAGDVGAFIGGAAALVQFAGMAPGLPGWYQVNLIVPADAPSGTDEIVIFASGIASQNGTTVEIQ